MLPCLEYLNSSELFLDHHSHTRPKNHSQTRHIDSVMNVDIRVAMAISLTVIILRWKSLLGKHCKLYNSSYLSLYLKFDCYCIFHSLIKQILYFLVWQRGSPSSSAAFGLNAPSMTPVQVFYPIIIVKICQNCQQNVKMPPLWHLCRFFLIWWILTLIHCRHLFEANLSQLQCFSANHQHPINLTQ